MACSDQLENGFVSGDRRPRRKDPRGLLSRRTAPVGSGDRLNLDLQRAEPARQVTDVGIAQRAGPSVIRVFATMYR